MRPTLAYQHRGPLLRQLALWCVLLLTSVLGAPAHAEESRSKEEAPVAVHGVTLFTLRSNSTDPSLMKRASAASRELSAVLEKKEPLSLRLQKNGARVDLMIGPRLIIQLTDDDAQAAGRANAQAYGEQLVPRVRDALLAEQRRSAIANTVFSISLVVFFGLVTLFLLRKANELVTRAETFLDAHPDKVPAIELRSLEVLGPAAVRSVVMVSLTVGRWILLLGLVYAWLVVSLSLFESTRALTVRLTGLVLKPISSLFERVAGSLPLLGVALLAGGAVAILVRLVALFFGSVARRETRLAWLPAELAPAASFALNTIIILAALVFGAPIITGDPTGALVQASKVALVLAGVALLPVLATVALGIGVIFLRRLKLGQRFRYGGEVGRVQEISLTHVHLKADDGSDVFVPHILTLWHATRVLTAPVDASIELDIASDRAPAEIIELLSRESAARVEVLDASAERIRYRLSRAEHSTGEQTRLWLSALEALKKAGIPLASTRDRA